MSRFEAKELGKKLEKLSGEGIEKKVETKTPEEEQIEILIKSIFENEKNKKAFLDLLESMGEKYPEIRKRILEAILDNWPHKTENLKKKLAKTLSNYLSFNPFIKTILLSLISTHMTHICLF